MPSSLSSAESAVMTQSGRGVGPWVAMSQLDQFGSSLLGPHVWLSVRSKCTVGFLLGGSRRAPGGRRQREDGRAGTKHTRATMVDIRGTSFAHPSAPGDARLVPGWATRCAGATGFLER